MTIRLSHLRFEIDSGLATRARLGLVTLATDYTVEHEFQQAITRLPGVALYVSRIEMAAETTAENLAAMAGRITPTTELLLPGEPFQAIAYGCSSATSIIGEDRVAELVRAAKPEAEVTNPITAACAALGAFGARRIGILTPYIAEVNAQVQASFEAAGFEIAAFGSFDEPTEARVGALAPGSILDGARQVAGAAKMDALFISCTNLRALDLAGPLEHELGIPVTASNHAMIWHSLRLAGIEDRLEGLGRLFMS